MLDMNYVNSLIDKHQIKAAEHIKQLEGKVANNQLNEHGWVYCEDIASYWSHSEVMYIPFTTIGYLDFLSKQIHAQSFINELRKIVSMDKNELEKLYFENTFSYWKHRNITRSIVNDKASEEFLDRVFK
ncbi:hypothetical protein SOV92_14800 [Pectobacterium brasiliense]|uniref:Uncharacterized protein n=2 Tax=Pectobacterium TaxID=122277 RepID=A0AAW9HFA5_9GAMM|nr:MULTISPECIES: hypothetical protein [Pectobacterium]MBS4429254.1 hypothetical protein [Pectobacterium punjabense]MDY4379079.1 hypothetical protein [Pectobacterium brasiliense]PTA65173.1 hypothetical protein C9I36_06000 [Pectobacterium punjabense]QJA20953.1 hypothetical protein E2566_13970 [Pectobacterium punjabense]